MRTANGNLIPDMGTNRPGGAWQGYNPMMNLGTKSHNPDDMSFEYRTNDNIVARAYVQLNLADGLKWITNLNVENFQYNKQSFWSDRYGMETVAAYIEGKGDLKAPSGNSASRYSWHTVNTTINNLLTYTRTFYSVHNISLLAGQEMTSDFSEWHDSYGAGIPDEPGLYEISNATRDFSIGGYEDNTRMLSWLSRAEYNYDEKYYVAGSLRRDGSSRFHPDNRWGTFWSAAGSWRVSRERFMESTAGWLNDLRLKASYGTTGNDQVGRYAYQGLYGISDFNYTGTYYMNRIPTPSLKWEKNAQFNAGIDFRLFNNLSGSVEYFMRKSQDLLFSRQTPPSTGWFDGYDQNIGAMENNGIEVSLMALVYNKPKYSWNINLNFTTQKNTITSLPDGDIYFNAGVGRFRMTEGRSRYELWMPSWAGLDPSDGRHFYWKKEFQLDNNGEIMRDDKGDPIVTSRVKTKSYGEVNTDLQRDWQGSSLPWAFGSLTNSFRIHDFDFSFMFYYSLGGKMVDQMYREGLNLRLGFGLSTQAEGRWTPEHTTGSLGRFSYNDNSFTNPVSSQFIFDNTFVRLRNTVLGYTVPRTVLRKIGMNNARIFVSADNLLTFGTAAKRGTDPEVYLTGVAQDGGTQGQGGTTVDEQWGPRKVFTGGIQISF